MNRQLACRKPIIWISPKHKTAELFYDFYEFNIQLTEAGYQALSKLIQSSGGGRGMWNKSSGFRLYGQVSGHLWNIPMEIWEDFKAKAIAILTDQQNWEGAGQ